MIYSYLVLLLVICSSIESISSFEKYQNEQKSSHHTEVTPKHGANLRHTDLSKKQGVHRNARESAEVSVSKETLREIKYSPRDPLYHSAISTEHTKSNSTGERISRRVGQEYGPPPPSSYYPSVSSSAHDPEPIIEIIIKDSNETLPAPPTYKPTVPQKPKKEPVQVFYVKYKKNPNSYGKEDEIIYEPPVAALTPATNHEEVETPEYSTPAATYYETPEPRPSTTLRTIIRPDSETYHGTSGVRVTFGKTEIHHAPSNDGHTLTHREDSGDDHISKRDSSPSASDLQPVRRNPEYRSPILNQNEFQALPSDYNKPTDYKNENFNSNFGQNNFDGPIRNGQTFNTPINNAQNFDGPVRHGSNFDGPVRNALSNFDNPIRTGPNYQSPLKNGPNNFEGPIRNQPNNFNKPSNVDIPFQQASSNNFVSRPNGASKFSFPINGVQQHQQQQFQKPNFEQEYQRPNFDQQLYKQPSQPLGPQYQQAVSQQQKTFSPSQQVYSQHELLQPPPQSSIRNGPPNNLNGPSNNINGQTPNFDNSLRNGLQQQNIYNSYQTTSIKNTPQQQFNNFESALRKPANFEQNNYQKPNSFEQTPYLQQQTKINNYNTIRHSEAIAPQQLNNYNKPSTAQQKQPSPILYNEQQQEQKFPYNKQRVPSINNIEDQNNLFVQSPEFGTTGPKIEYGPSGPTINTNIELSDEEYKLLMEKQRLQQLKVQQKDKEQQSIYQKQQQQQLLEQQKQEQLLEQQRQHDLQEQRQQELLEQQQKQQLLLQQQSQRQRQVELLQQQKHQQQQQQQQQQQYEQPKQTVQPSSSSAISSLSKYQVRGKPNFNFFDQEHVYSKPTTTKYSPSSPSTSTTSGRYQPVTSTTTSAPVEVSTELSKQQKEKYNKNLLQLPDEVPADIREQLISSGILGNADIQILDYDKVGDIPIENLPPEALANFYGNGGAKTITKRNAQNPPEPNKQVEMKVVKFDPSTQEGQKIADSYIQGPTDVTLDPVVLNDASYNRYLPLKVNGASFPLPNSELLKNRKISSVVVLAPVDYESIVNDEETTNPSTPIPTQAQGHGQTQIHDHRAGKAVKVSGVHFISGNILNDLVKNPTEENYKNWLQSEKSFPLSQQSVVLLVTSPNEESKQEIQNKEVFMYDLNSENLSELKGDLSETFLQVAESNASSEDLENITQVDEEEDSHVSRTADQQQQQHSSTKENTSSR